MIVRDDQRQRGETSSAAGDGTYEDKSQSVVGRKRIKTESGAVFMPLLPTVADRDSGDESEARTYKKNLTCWTPVLTSGLDGPVKSKSVRFITTMQLHQAMGTSEENMRLLMQPASHGSGFYLKLGKWDLTDADVAAELISVYDLPPDKDLIETTRAWLQATKVESVDTSLAVQIASSHLNLRAEVPCTDSDPSFALLLPGRRKAKAQQKEALAK